MVVDDCTPAARVTKSLLGYGVIAGPFYLIGSVVQGVLTPGFSFTSDSWSLLSLGSYGWVHVIVFVLTGLMVAAAGVGFRRHLHGVAGPALLVYGALLVVAGLAAPDARGAALSAHGIVHLAAGGIGFIAFAIAACSSARHFARLGRTSWTVWSVLAGALLLIGFAAVATGSSAAPVVLGFTTAVVVSWTWLATASVRHYQDAAHQGRIAVVSTADLDTPTASSGVH